MTVIRVVSYNLKDFTLDRHAAARVVRSVDPDVLCLQEVPRRLFASWRVSAFAAECGMFWSGHHRGSGGTTILTSLRVQVAESRHVRLRVLRSERRAIEPACPAHVCCSSSPSRRCWRIWR